MKLCDGRVVYSPTDLIVFLESPFASWMDRRFIEDRDTLTPDEDDPFLQILQARGDAHEGSYLETLTASGRDICEIPPKDSLEQTREAVRAGRKIIYQAYLESGGFADFLCRVPEPPSEPRYVVWDTMSRWRGKAKVISRKRFRGNVR